MDGAHQDDAELVEEIHNRGGDEGSNGGGAWGYDHGHNQADHARVAALRAQEAGADGADHRQEGQDDGQLEDGAEDEHHEGELRDVVAHRQEELRLFYAALLAHKELDDAREDRVADTRAGEKQADTQHDERHHVAPCLHRDGRRDEHPGLVEQHRQHERNAYGYRDLELDHEGVGELGQDEFDG